MDTLSQILNKRIIIWGIGHNGRKFADMASRLNINIAYFVDSFSGVNSICINEDTYPVYQPEIILDESFESVFVIVTPSREEGIIDLLEKWGLTAHVQYSTLTDNIMPFVYGALFKQECTLDMLEKPELFKQVEIETVNRCNNDCSFCPGNKKLDKRKLKIMDENLFEAILNELRNMEYMGSIGLIGTGEPFLDADIVSRIKKVKEYLPNSMQFLSTNGTMLTLSIYKEIIPYLDSLAINNYTSAVQLTNNLQEISDYNNMNLDLKSKVTLQTINKNEIRTTRGGYAPNKEHEAPRVGCYMPFQFLSIKSDGKVSLCCCDYLPQYQMGDLKTQSISDIWYGDKFKKLREILITKGRPNLKLCCNCDTYFVLRD